MSSCKHRNAYPTLYNDGYGYMWCTDCGAIRDIHKTGDNSYSFSKRKGWLLPKGYDSVLKQIDKGRG